MVISKVEISEAKKPKKKSQAGRKKGGEKSGGRLKGTPNKNSLKFIENFDLCGINLVHEFLECIKKLEPKDQLGELKFLFRHAYPQLKEIELGGYSGHENPARLLSTDELLARKL